ncbi:MAG: PDZ domain-containing protein [Desulfarculus sp.]|nr:MAG: PDZ domain-containing protein [Desulfarculus sp.]
MSRWLSIGLALLLACGLAPPAWADQAKGAGRVTPVVRVVRQAGPAVVNISSTGRVRVNPFRSGDEMLDRFFQEFFQPLEREQTNLGSGLIVDGKRGLIVTNSHVVAGGSEIRVQLADRRVFKARLLGADPSSDLAVLQIKPQGTLPQVKMGDSAGLMIGESLIAIGNPFGLQHTVTTGVVSALNRRVPTGRGEWMGGLIQTDASINPGNSGGPLLNLDGEVVGINTAIFQRAQGIGFAIPVNRLRRVVEDLLAHGRVRPVWLGLTLQDLNPRLASHFGLTSALGVLVLGVRPQSPAAKTGLGRGAVILSLDGLPLEDAADYQSRLESIAPRESVRLLVLSQGRRREISLRAQAYPLELGPELSWELLGLTPAELDGDTAHRHQVPPGSALMVVKLRAGSRAARMGLQPGDLIRRVNGEPVKKVQDFYLLLARVRHLPQVALTLQRGHTSRVFRFGR